MKLLVGNRHHLRVFLYRLFKILACYSFLWLNKNIRKPILLYISWKTLHSNMDRKLITAINLKVIVYNQIKRKLLTISTRSRN